MLGLLIAISLITVTSQAFAASIVAGKIQVNTSQKDYALRSTAKGYKSGNSPRDYWHDTAIERLMHLSVDDIVLDRFILSVDNGFKINTLVYDTMMTRFTLGKSDITVLPYAKRYNLGLGFTTPLSKRLAIDTSVNLTVSSSSDVIFWVSLPAIRF